MGDSGDRPVSAFDPQLHEIVRVQESAFGSHPPCSIAAEKAGARTTLSPKINPVIGEVPKLTLSAHSLSMQEVFRAIPAAADSEVNTLIIGESGTGKELVARAIHAQSRRAAFRFVALNAASLAESVLESELFGHEKDAFTGARSARAGFFEFASRGTLFLDEVGDMPLKTQVKILRAVEYMEIYRIGSNEPVRVDVRILAATNRDLEELVREGTFRQDLYYRLSGILIYLPALRDRQGDLETLIQEILANSPEARRKNVRGISAPLLERLKKYSWPGNVRELRNVIDATVAHDRDGLLGLEDVPLHLGRLLGASLKPSTSGSVLDQERDQRIVAAVKACKGNKSQAARLLGVHRTTVHRHFKKS